MIDRALFRVDVPEAERGLWEVKRFTTEVPTQHMGMFNPPGTYTALLRWDWSNEGTGVDGSGAKQFTWMSDLPSEAESAIPFIERAHGHVLVTGLGLGSILRPLAAQERVDTITIVELNQDVVDLVWPTYQHLPKLALVVGDAHRPRRLQLPRQRFTCAWHDIWRDIDPHNLREMVGLRDKWPVDAFTMCWTEELLLRQVEEKTGVKLGWWPGRAA